jgi:pimeloyl-ACP methyl ester carboxylesterase
MRQAPASFAALGGEDLFNEDASVQAADVPFWREALCGFDWLALRSWPGYYGLGVPRGQGEPVVLVPGFLASDLSLMELFAWLARIGYQPHFAHVGRNADCPDYMASALLNRVRRIHAETGQRVRIIGHSLGGMLARSAALECPDYASVVITLGSPFRDMVRAHPAVLAVADALRQGGSRGAAAHVKPTCFSGHCVCTFTRNTIAPGEFQVPHFAVFSPVDGVAHPESCMEPDAALNSEVNSTHIGMAWNPMVFQVIAERLREGL